MPDLLVYLPTFPALPRKHAVENIGEMAVVECEGRIVQSEAAFKLREAVTSQTGARIVVLELSEVDAVEGGGLDMLVFLQRWARDHNIRLFLLFNPSKSVRNGLNVRDDLRVLHSHNGRNDGAPRIRQQPI